MRAARIIGLIVVLYLGSYIAFRLTNLEIWESDRHAYVIFPAGVGSAFYYFWRPLSYADGALTGMRFHIGSHRP